MTRLRLIILVVLIVVLGGGAAAYVAKKARDRARLTPIYQQQLTHADPQIRRDAAAGLLGFDRNQPDVMLILAESLVELGEYADARLLLDELRLYEAVDMKRAMVLWADSCVREASDIIARADPDDAELISRRVKELVAEAESQRQVLNSIEGAQTEALVVGVRTADVRSALSRLWVRQWERAIIGQTLAQQHEDVKITSVSLAEAEAETAGHDAVLNQTAAQVLERDPNNQVVRYALIQSHLRSRRFDAARRVARELIDLPKLDARLMGRITNQLLDLEMRFGEAVTLEDRRIARALLSHDGLDEPDDPGIKLAKLFIWHYEGDPAETARRARELRAEPAYARHMGVLRVLIFALIRQDKADEAIGIIRPYAEQAMPETLSAAKYLLGAAYRANHNAALGDEVLRQSVEADPESLPPRLMLAESLIERGNAAIAGPDIEAAARINPKHPKVVALRARLLVDDNDHVELMALFNDRLANVERPIHRLEPTIIAAMIMDDVAAVRRLSRSMLDARSDAVTALLANAWAQASPHRRPTVAVLMARSMREALGRDPMSTSRPPGYEPVAVGDLSPPLAGSTAPDARDKSIGLLTNNWFEPWLEEVGLAVVESALERWPNDATLLAQSGVLNLWLGNRDAAQAALSRLTPQQHAVQGVAGAVAFLADDLPTVRSLTADGAVTPVKQWLRLAIAVAADDEVATHQALLDYQADHPWAQLPLILVLRDALERDRGEQALNWISLVHGVNDRLSTLVRARFFLAVGRIDDAFREVEAVTRDLDPESELRRMAAEIRARVYLAKDRSDLAVASFDHVALAGRHHPMSLKVAAISLAITSDRMLEASEAAAVLLADDRTSDYWRDRLLLRSTAAMTPERFGNLVERLLVFKSSDVLLRLYRARAHASQNDQEQALASFLALRADQPQSPRVLVELARWGAAYGRLAPALDALTELKALGGAHAATADRMIESLSSQPKDEGTGQ